MPSERPMQIQSEFPTTEKIEMYITEDTSGQHNQSDVVLVQVNESVRTKYPGYLFTPDAMTSETPQTARGVSLVIFIALGFAFNSFMVVSIVPNRRLRNVRNILLVHLGCTGLISTILINLVTAVVSFTGRWFGGVTVCQMYGFIITMVTLVTSWTITALSWDKYQTIACPLHHSFTGKVSRLVGCLAVVWTLACMFSLPPLVSGSSFVFHPEKGICFLSTRSPAGQIYAALFLVVAIYLPLGVMLFCYSHIYKIARNQSSRIAATMIQMTCVIQATIAPNSQATGLSIKGTKAMCTIFQLVGAFVVVYIPMSVILLTEMFAPEEFKVNSVLSSSVTLLFLSAPVVHSSVYGLRNKTLRLSFRRYLRRKFRYYCYKDKRRNSVKSFRSFRSSSFKAAMLARRNQHNQNGGAPGLRRTQSFPIRSTRGGIRTLHTYGETNGTKGLPVPEQEVMTRPRSFNALSTEHISENPAEEDIEISVPDDILDIDADVIIVV